MKKGKIEKKGKAITKKSTREKKRITTEKKLEEEIKKKDKEIDEYKERLLRLQADFENYRKHLEREKEEFTKNANESLIRDLLNVLDNIEIAIKEIKKKDKEIAKGIELIYKDFLKILEKRGLKEIISVGKRFDPYYHEVMMQEFSDKEEGIILEEFQKGYTLNGKVIRHSKVKISKGKKIDGGEK